MQIVQKYGLFSHRKQFNAHYRHTLGVRWSSTRHCYRTLVLCSLLHHSRGQMVIRAVGFICVSQLHARVQRITPHTPNAVGGLPKGARSCLLQVPKKMHWCCIQHYGFWLPHPGLQSESSLGVATDPSDFLGVPRSCCACNSSWRSDLAAATAAMSSASAESGSTGRRSLPAADRK